MSFNERFELEKKEFSKLLKERGIKSALDQKGKRVAEPEEQIKEPVKTSKTKD